MDIPLYEKIYNHINDRIRRGELKSGDRVPSEKELADQFNVSRITSKKALELLAQTGVVDRLRGKGSFVADDQHYLSSTGTSIQVPISVAHETKRVGLIIPDFGDSFGSDLFRAIESRCSELDFQLLVRLTHDSREAEEESIRSLVKYGVDGIVVFPVHGEHYNEQLIRLVIEDFPVVLVDRYLKGIAARSVYSDNHAAAKTLTQNLIDEGHRNIAFISPPTENTSTIEERINGFKEAMLENGIIVTANHILTTLTSTMPTRMEQLNHDYDKLEKFVRAHPELTTFVACEYNLAVIIQQVVNEVYKREEKEVVCFDNPKHYNRSYFTHIRQNETEMGSKAIDILQSLWKGESVPMNHVIDFEFIKKSND